MVCPSKVVLYQVMLSKFLNLGLLEDQSIIINNKANYYVCTTVVLQETCRSAHLISPTFASSLVSDFSQSLSLFFPSSSTS